MQTRNLVPEWMDDPNLDPVEHRRALAGLRRINWVSGTGGRIAQEIIRLARRESLASVSVLDLGCGSGDVARSIAHRCALAGVSVRIVGWDISPQAIETARSIPTHGASNSVWFEQRDAFAPSEDRFDVVYCCLFLHHFSDADAERLLKRMAQLARRAVLVDDLCRTSLGLALANVGCRILSRSPVVHFDGPQSVRAAFTIEEARGLALRAGWREPSIVRHWPERYLLSAVSWNEDLGDSAISQEVFA